MSVSIVSVRYEQQSMPSPDDPLTLVPFEGDVKLLDAALQRGATILHITDGPITDGKGGRPVRCFFYHLAG